MCSIGGGGGVDSMWVWNKTRERDETRMRRGRCRILYECVQRKERENGPTAIIEGKRGGHCTDTLRIVEQRARCAWRVAQRKEARRIVEGALRSCFAHCCCCCCCYQISRDPARVLLLCAPTRTPPSKSPHTSLYTQWPRPLHTYKSPLVSHSSG